MLEVLKINNESFDLKICSERGLVEVSSKEDNFIIAISISNLIDRINGLINKDSYKIDRISKIVNKFNISSEIEKKEILSIIDNVPLKTFLNSL